jgi:hypothetical protein
MAYFWCIEHKTVEGDDGCRPHRLGPYPTEEAAQRALQTVQERNAKWDAEDDAWENG